MFLTGCTATSGGPAAAPQTSTGTATTAGPGASAPGTPATASDATATAPQEAAWNTFTTSDGLATWQMPANWTASLQPSGPGQFNYGVTGPDAKVRLYFADNIEGVGGPGCIPGYKPAYPYQLLDHAVVALPVTGKTNPVGVSPRVAYEAIQFPDHVFAGLGITQGLQNSDGTACEFGHFVLTATQANIIEFAAQYPAADGSWGDRSLATMDEAQAYMGTAEYKTVARILASLHLKGSPTGLDGVYTILENAECGVFDLSGQVLTVSAGTATITTPGQTLTGTAVENAGVWHVNVSGPQPTIVHLTGTVSGTQYSGSGNYGGIHPGGENGWTCDIPSFTATLR